MRSNICSCYFTIRTQLKLNEVIIEIPNHSLESTWTNLKSTLKFKLSRLFRYFFWLLRDTHIPFVYHLLQTQNRLQIFFEVCPKSSKIKVSTAKACDFKMHKYAPHSFVYVCRNHMRREIIFIYSAQYALSSHTGKWRIKTSFILERSHSDAQKPDKLPSQYPCWPTK